jgi:hypothetical protein
MSETNRAHSGANSDAQLDRPREPGISALDAFIDLYTGPNWPGEWQGNCDCPECKGRARCNKRLEAGAA